MSTGIPWRTLAHPSPKQTAGHRRCLPNSHKLCWAPWGVSWKWHTQISAVVLQTFPACVWQPSHGKQHSLPFPSPSLTSALPGCPISQGTPTALRGYDMTAWQDASGTTRIWIRAAVAQSKPNFPFSSNKMHHSQGQSPSPCEDHSTIEGSVKMTIAKCGRLYLLPPVWE